MLILSLRIKLHAPWVHSLKEKRMVVLIIHMLNSKIKQSFVQVKYLHIQQVGISRTLCEQIRKELAPPMIEYNFISCLWEWCYLGMYDLLMAAQDKLIKTKIKLESQQIDELYNYAVNIALLQSHSSKC